MRIHELLKTGAKSLAGVTPDLLMAGGASAVAYGASLVYLPAGFITGGVLAVVAGWILARGAR